MSVNTINQRFSTYGSVSLANILDKDLYNEAIIYGSDNALSQKISSATIMDIEEILEWIHPHEIIIIGRFMEKSFNEDFIKKIHQLKVPAIISKKKFLKHFTDNLLCLMKQYDIPIIFVEDNLSWSDVILSIQDSIIESQTKKLIQIDTYYNQVISWLSNNLTFDSICQEFYKLTHHSLAILNESFYILDYSYNLNWKDIASFLRNYQNFRICSVGRQLNKFSTNGYMIEDFSTENNIIVIPIHNHTDRTYYFVLFLSKDQDKLPTEVLSQVNILAQLYMLYNRLIHATNTSNIYFKSSVFYELMQLINPNLEIKNRISLSLGTMLQDKYFLIKIQHKNDTYFFDASKISELLSEVY